MPCSFNLNDIQKVFDTSKNYTITLSGKDLNIILSALEIPMMPENDFLDACDKVTKKITQKNCTEVCR